MRYGIKWQMVDADSDAMSPLDIVAQRTKKYIFLLFIIYQMNVVVIVPRSGVICHSQWSGQLVWPRRHNLFVTYNVFETARVKSVCVYNHIKDSHEPLNYKKNHF